MENLRELKYFLDQLNSEQLDQKILIEKVEDGNVYSFSAYIQKETLLQNTTESEYIGTELELKEIAQSFKLNFNLNDYKVFRNKGTIVFSIDKK